MTETSTIEIKWNAIGKSFLRLCLAFGAGFFVLALLNRIPDFKLYLIFATLYGLCSSYIYQETKSLVGPILIHNVTDGLLYSIDIFFTIKKEDVKMKQIKSYLYNSDKLRKEYKTGIGKMHPHTYLIYIISSSIFLLIWILDSFIFKFSTEITGFIPLLPKIIIFIIIIVVAIVLGIISHEALFSKDHVAANLIKNGVFAHVRHPMYLSMLLVYIALTILTMSLVSIILWIIMFIFFNKMATYEEKDLEGIIGQEYLEYKKKVPKWIPRLIPARFKKFF